MAKRRRKAQADAAADSQPGEVQEETSQFEVLDPNAILNEECEEEDGKRFVTLYPSVARKYTDRGVRLQQVEE